MSRTKVETRFPFGSLVPLWSRQVNNLVIQTIDNKYLTNSGQLDPLYHGQILLLREDCPALLYQSIH